MLRYEDFLSKIKDSKECGRYITGICPFHSDSSPSLLVFRDGWFRCLGCNRNGNWKTLWNKLSGQNIIVRSERHTAWNAPRINGDLAELTYQAHLDLVNFSTLQWYLQDRGLEGRIETNELGYMDGWYTIPVYSDGNFVTTVFRAAPHIQEATKLRYWCKHVPVPFIPDQHLVKTSDELYVVYGIFDALTLADLRFPVITSTSGKDTFNPEWLDSYRKRIYIVPDKGEEASAYSLAAHLGWRGKVLQLEFPQGKKDCNGFYEIGKGDMLATQLRNKEK